MKNKINIEIIQLVLAVITIIPTVKCFIAKEDKNTEVVKKYRPILIICIGLLLMLSIVNLLS